MECRCSGEDFGKCIYGVSVVGRFGECLMLKSASERGIETFGLGIRKLWRAGNGAGVATFGNIFGVACGIGVCECVTIGRFYM